MKIKVRWCLKTDLFTHKETIYENWDDFSSFMWFVLHQLSDYKCVHIYNLSNTDFICDKENEDNG